MKKFEHLIIPNAGSMSHDSFLRAADEVGEEGWELVHVGGNGRNTNQVAYFKREIPDPKPQTPDPKVRFGLWIPPYEVHKYTRVTIPGYWAKKTNGRLFLSKHRGEMEYIKNRDWPLAQVRQLGADGLPVEEAE